MISIIPVLLITYEIKHELFIAVGKTFQGSQLGMAPTPVRKALGDVNTRNVGGRMSLKEGHLKNAPAKPAFLLKPPAPTSKHIKPNLQEKQVYCPVKKNCSLCHLKT